MALTFTSWTACDDPDNPTLDWTDADALRGRLLWRYAEALRQALLERCEVTGYTAPTDLQTPVPVGARPDWYWAWWFKSCMNQLIIRFVNHTGHGGDWSGMLMGDWDDVAPAWSQAEILQECTDTTRLEVLAGTPLLARWAFQQYQLLNLLRWNRVFTRPINRATHEMSGAGGDEDLAVAKADGIANYWSEVFKPSSYSAQGISWIVKQEWNGNEFYHTYLQRARAQFELVGLSISLKRTLDLYIGESCHSWLDPQITWPWNWTADVEATGLVSGEVVKWQEWTTPINTPTLTSNWLGNYDTLPPHWTDPPGGAPKTTGYQGWRANSYKSVGKWNVPDGFTFQ